MRKKTNPIDAARLKYEAALKASTRKPAPKGHKRVVAKKTVKRVVRRANPSTVSKERLFPFSEHVKYNFDSSLKIAFENLQKAVHGRKSETVIQAHVSYVQGLVDAATYLEYFNSAALGQKWKREIAKLVPLRMV